MSGCTSSNCVKLPIRQSGAKSLMGSYAMVLLRLGAADIGVLEARKIVEPSGAERATCTAAIAPLAPGLFSTITLWPSAVPSRCPMMRPIRSLPLPGPNGTTKVIGLFGKP